MLENVRIGTNIRSIRKARGMTQDQLADRLAMISGAVYSASAIGAWERSERDPSPDIIRALCYALNCSIYSLYTPDECNAETAVRAIEEMACLNARSHESLLYIFSEWSGDLPPLIETNRAYAMLPIKRRAAVIRFLLDQAMAAKAAGEFGDDLPVQLELIEHGLQRLEAAENG